MLMTPTDDKAGATASTGGGAASADIGAPDAKVVGTWKVDVANTTIPATTDEQKKEETGMRLDAKADGTYAITGSKTPASGKWGVKDGKVTFTDSKGTNPPLVMTLSADGMKMSILMPGDKGKSMTMTMMKA